MHRLTEQEKRALERLRKTLGLKDPDLFTILSVADVRIRRYEGRKI